MKTVLFHRYFQISPRDHVYFKSIFEAYEGLAMVSTVPGGNGMVDVAIMPWAEADIDALVRALASEIELTETAPPGGDEAMESVDA